MNKYFIGVILAYLLSANNLVMAQGPPITSDKPIMLGSNQAIIKTLTEIRVLEHGTFVRVPLMLHYLPTANSLVAVHIPMMFSEFTHSHHIDLDNGSSFGDVNLMLKYQFYRKDGKAKTFRLVAKFLETFPTGRNVGIRDFGINEFQHYFALVAGYETIKHGISNEFGYKIIPNHPDEINYKLGFGLPLLKPVYPVNQINLYFEYNTNYFPENGNYELLYAQGIQYAIKQLTFETAIQFPLKQKVSAHHIQKYSLFIGTRYIF